MTAGLGIDGRPRTVIVLAAGEGKRMRSTLPKVLHPLLGRTMLGHVLAAVAGAVAGEQSAGAPRTLVVVGNGADQVRAHLAQIAPRAETVLQAQQHGTGHAVRVALAACGEVQGTVVVLSGDAPLLSAQTIRDLVAHHESAGAAATVLTAEVAVPRGLGRIVRDSGGAPVGIVEERDATPPQRAIREINGGAYAFDAAALRTALGKLSRNNDQGEEYLTDVFGLLLDAGLSLAAYQAADPTETLGANDRAGLAVLRAHLRDRVNHDWLCAGVTIIDPTTTWIDVTATLGADALIEPNTHLRGSTSIASGAVVGPDTTIVDSAIGAGASVIRAHVLNSVVGEDALVGPYAYLRPGTVLATRAKIGTFVEAKAAQLGAGAKVPHLTYVGDATIGAGTNIGASSVFVNYDGVNKHRTTIGAHARTGSDNMFVAPVTVGDGAYTAAGSVITEDVPPGAMAVARARQRNIEGWVARRRAGTPAAVAAQLALAEQANVDAGGPGVESAPGNGDDGDGPAGVPTKVGSE